MRKERATEKKEQSMPAQTVTIPDITDKNRKQASRHTNLVMDPILCAKSSGIYTGPIRSVS
jgi:hypothetical protein